jgi:Arc/MetJ-type ribon-helix-helix transcriptional regulator
MSEKKKTNRTNPIPVRFSLEEKEKLEGIARQRRIQTGENVSMSEVIRELLKAGLKDYLEEKERNKDEKL